MKLPPCEISPDAPLTPFERACGGLGILSFAIGLLLVATLCGCRAFYENAGSRTVVGSVTAPVDISDSSDNIAAKLLYSMDGASVYTAKDSLVKIHYSNVYTNTYFGIVGTHGNQDLSVEIEPLATDESATNSCCCTLAVPATNVSASASMPTASSEN